eukprot:358504-Chlamydomonas_euryale.AAC.1
MRRLAPVPLRRPLFAQDSSRGGPPRPAPVAASSLSSSDQSLYASLPPDDGRPDLAGSCAVIGARRVVAGGLRGKEGGTGRMGQKGGS